MTNSAKIRGFLRLATAMLAICLVLGAALHSFSHNEQHASASQEKSCDLCLSLTGFDSAPAAVGSVFFLVLGHSPFLPALSTSSIPAFLSSFSARAPPSVC